MSCSLLGRGVIQSFSLKHHDKRDNNNTKHFTKLLLNKHVVSFLFFLSLIPFYLPLPVTVSQCPLFQTKQVWARISCCLERKTCGQKVCSNPGRSGRRILFSRVNFVCWLLFSVRSISVLLQWHVKDPIRAASRWHVTPKKHIHFWPNEVGMGWLCCCPGIVWEPIWKRANKQLIRKYLVTVISARWATVDWSWPKEWN